MGLPQASLYVNKYILNVTILQYLLTFIFFLATHHEIPAKTGSPGRMLSMLGTIDS